MPEVANAMLKGEVKFIGDSRLDNLKKIRSSGYKKRTNAFKNTYGKRVKRCS
ncbi:unnamed protein product [marine sediment metagenome]|uniref:Uncharacterized protein n=1 Tax=marine sediment metagenome TaxID=412755 RepID=X1B049_9ZZZZ